MVETRKTMNAYLLLANGMVFAGQSVGAEGVTVGEVVFATGMVGFQETLTDPSYYGQIITQTYPLIGNYGMNKDDMESDKIWAKGYIVREACKTPSNWRCEETLDSFLKKNNTIGIEGIDTRHLTRIIRESGVMNGAILTTFDPADPANKEKTDALLAEIRAYAVTDAVKNVTCAEPEVFNPAGETHIVLMHYGCKRNIVRCLVKRGCKVTVMPAFATDHPSFLCWRRIHSVCRMSPVYPRCLRHSSSHWQFRQTLVSAPRRRMFRSTRLRYSCQGSAAPASSPHRSRQARS